MSAAAAIDLTAIDDDEEETTLALLDSLSNETSRYCKIVGIRYYNGVAHPGEYVQLHREPRNPYDRHAIRVDNIQGQKVGHIKRELAAVLAPLMDRYSSSSSSATHPQLTLDASIPGCGNFYELPVQIDFRGREADPQLAQVRHELAQALARVRQTPKPTTTTTASRPPVVVTSRKLDWQQQQQQLDDMFAQQQQQQLVNLPLYTAPTRLVTTLLEHQIQAVQWLVSRERGVTNPFYQPVVEAGKTRWLCEITQASQDEAPAPVRSSLVADDMGLGKTLATLVLILCHPPVGRDYNQPIVGMDTTTTAAAAVTTGTSSSSSTSPSSSADRPPTKVTPEPVSLQRPTKTDLKKIKVPVLQMVLLDAGLPVPRKKNDLVAAVDDGLEQGAISLQQYYSAMAKTPPPPPSASAITPARTSSSITTLIVCPVSVMSNWQDQIDTHIQPNTLRVAFYYGTDRHAVLDSLHQVDILVVSYNTLQHDYTSQVGSSTTKKSETSQPPPLKKFKSHSIFTHSFHRIILDEAHIIRSAQSRTFRACAALQADCRICLTGTPLQNKAEDIQSLLQFLRLPPFDDKNVFRRAIAQPIKDGDDRGLALLRAVMAHVALRRNKSMVQLRLPTKTVELRQVALDESNAHFKIYSTIYESAKRVFQAALTAGGDVALQQQQSSVFEILTRLRQACCSGKLVPMERLQRAEQVLATLANKDTLSVEEASQLLEKLKGAMEMDNDVPPECAICLDQMDAAAAVVLRGCGHVFCQICIARVAKGPHSDCPLCRKSFREDEMIKWSVAATAAANQNNETKQVALSEQMDNLGPSPKIEALLLAIEEMKAGEKGVIFSQFTKFLNEIEKHLTLNNLTFTRIDGSKSATQRVEALQIFGKDGGPQFMLCSLHAAGTGINLTRANHVFMMDTWWNKGTEQQAQDRVHRISQTRDVRVVRFVAADTCESRMVDLQEAKAAVGKGAFENLSTEEKKKARLGDLKKLLDLS